MIPRWLRWVLGAVVLGVTIWLFLLPRVGDAEEAVDAILGINAALLGVGAGLTAAAIASQAQLTRVALPSDQRPGLAAMVRIELATMAVSHTVPGGTAAGTALAFRLLTSSGVGRSAAGFALGVRGIGSAVVLNVILWLALIVSVQRRGFEPIYTTAAALGAALLTGVGLLALALLRAPEPTTAVVCRIARPIPFVDHDAVPDVLDNLAGELRRVFGNRGLAAQATAWAAGYWLLNAASLGVLLHAFGWDVRVVSLLVAFGVVNVLAAIPITPRGLGLVEAALIPLLTGFGATVSQATLGVLTFRLLSFFIPIPIGTLSYVSLKLVEPAVGREREEAKSEARRELEKIAREKAEPLDRWAARRGLRIDD